MTDEFYYRFGDQQSIGYYYWRVARDSKERRYRMNYVFQCIGIAVIGAIIGACAACVINFIVDILGGE